MTGEAKAGTRNIPKSAPLEYEFSQLDNQRFTRLAGAMQWVASLQLVAAAVGVFVAYPAALAGLRRDSVVDTLLPIAAVLTPTLIAGWTFRAGGHLRLIVQTEGDNIRHLMAAVTELSKLYLLQIWLFLAVIGFVTFSLVARGAFTLL